MIRSSDPDLEYALEWLRSGDEPPTRVSSPADLSTLVAKSRMPSGSFDEDELPTLRRVPPPA